MEKGKNNSNNGNSTAQAYDDEDEDQEMRNDEGSVEFKGECPCCHKEATIRISITHE